MRDPNRIPVVLAKLEEFWRAHPDWRLGQIIANAGRTQDGAVSSLVIFNIEDDMFLRNLEELGGRAL